MSLGGQHGRGFLGPDRRVLFILPGDGIAGTLPDQIIGARALTLGRNRWFRPRAIT